jgi:hypothetical protein
MQQRRKINDGRNDAADDLKWLLAGLDVTEPSWSRDRTVRAQGD